MTRQEFIDHVTTWYELRDFCWDYGCCVLDEVYDAEGRDEVINEAIYNEDWKDIRAWVEGIPDGRDGYFLMNSTFDWDVLDDYDDFDGYKNEVLDWADDVGGVWEDEDEEPDDWERVARPESAPAASESNDPEFTDAFALNELFAVSYSIAPRKVPPQLDDLLAPQAV